MLERQPEISILYSMVVLSGLIFIPRRKARVRSHLRVVCMMERNSSRKMMRTILNNGGEVRW